MSLDMFIVFASGSDIKGETKDAGFKDTHGVDVLAWSWGASNSGSRHTSTGGGAGKANFQDISLTKYVDTATPQLLAAAARGIHIDDAKLTVRKAGGKQEPYLELDMTDCLITSVSTGGSGGEDRLTENVTINFASYTIKYYAQDASGNVSVAGSSGYDISANEEKAAA